MKLDFKQLLDTATRATYLAGKEVLRQYKTEYHTEIKQDGSPVTSADLAANDILMKYLLPTKVTAISEESGHYTHQFRQNNAYWCIDPIDGTHDFVDKTDEFCVSVGLVDENTSKLGVLYAPALDLFYFAAEGIGSFKFISSFNNLEKYLENEDFLDFLISNSESLPNHPLQDKQMFMASRYHRHPKIEAHINKLKEKYPNLELVTMGSAIKLGLMAERKANEYLRFTRFNFWDVAGGHAICKYAGLKLLQPNTNQEINYEREDMRIEGYAMKW